MSIDICPVSACRPCVRVEVNGLADKAYRVSVQPQPFVQARDMLIVPSLALPEHVYESPPGAMRLREEPARLHVPDQFA